MKPSNSKAPALLTAHKAFSEQLSFLPAPALSVTLPTHESREGQTLMQLSVGPVTQEDWLNFGNGWRLAAGIHALKAMGWPIESEWVNSTSRSKKIKCYYLPSAALEVGVSWCKCAQDAANDAWEFSPC